jgi:hypothetical protein
MARQFTIAEENIEAQAPTTIRAVVIDPRDQTIREVPLPTVAGDPARGFGVQIAPEALVELLGSKIVERADIGDGEVVLYSPGSGPAWWLSDALVEGVGVVVAYVAKPLDSYGSALRGAEGTAWTATFGDDAPDEEEDEADAREAAA